MTGDQRLFAYPLDPQLQRLRWRLDEQLADLANALSLLEPLRGRCDALAEAAVEVVRDMAQAQARRLDPARDRHALDYLAGLHRRHASAEKELHEAEQRVSDRREALAATQMDIDILEHDRQDCLTDHLREVDRRSQRETDQDWTARAAWKTRDTAEREVLP